MLGGMKRFCDLYTYKKKIHYIRKTVRPKRYTRKWDLILKEQKLTTVREKHKNLWNSFFELKLLMKG